jgi:hypothetical protein
VNSTRATVSAVPPGGHPTTTRTGLVGHSASWAEVVVVEAVTRPAAAVSIAARQAVLRRSVLSFQGNLLQLF